MVQKLGVIEMTAPSPNEDLAAAEAIQERLEEARRLAERYSREEMRTVLDTTIGHVESEIRALRRIVSSSENDE